VLFREAVPLLPHLLDLPKHLAVVSSVVVRYSRTNHYDPSLPVSSDERPFKEFCLRCMEVEEQALHRVSQLARKPGHAGRREITHMSKSANVSVSVSASSPISIPRRERKESLTENPHRRRKSSRPSTAPSNGSTSALSTSTPEKSVATHATMQSQRSLSGDVSFTPSGLSRPPPRHPRSTSTDSVLTRRNPYEDLSSTPDASITSADPSEVGKRKVGLFRAIWTRK